MLQKTIRQSAQISGIGLHTGFASQLRFLPAPPNSGIVFVRTDLKRFAIPAIRQHVAKVSYATSLMKQGVLIATVEHALSAVTALGIDNLILEVDTMEVPIADGSAFPFLEVLEQAGIQEQESNRNFIRLLRPFRVASGDKWMEASPSDVLDIHYSIEFPHPLIQRQEYSYRLDEGSYRQEIASARTFGFAEEVDALRKAGLAKGGSLENAVVLNGEGVMNTEGLRFPDEFVRHKVLDLIGDFCLLGKPLLAKVRAHRAGHALHYTFCSQILKNPSCYEIVSGNGRLPALPV